MPKNAANIIILLILLLWLVFLIRLAVKALNNRYSPVKTVHAVVVHKQKTESFSKYAGSGSREKYVVVFNAEGKKLSFYVSAFSYSSYRLNESGVLKYKGSKLLDFH